MSARSGTRRKRRRRSTAGSRFMTLLLALGGVVALLALLMRLAGPKPAPAAAVFTAPPVATAIPSASPEPVPGLPAVDVASWELRLIDFDHPLGESFEPPELTYIGDNESVDSRVAHALNELIADAKAAGNPVYVCSGYRDYSTQYSIYWEHIDRYEGQGMTREEADAATRLEVQYPGCSEHQSGLCVDLLESASQPMEPYIGGSGLMQWLEENCAGYGFVVRYPDGKTGVTGVEYEPWHLRYVGVEAAGYMMEHDLCLEEFLALYNM